MLAEIPLPLNELIITGVPFPHLRWKFRCPSCGHIATVADYKKAGAPVTAVGFSCVGRWLEVRKEAFDDKDKRKIPCNYAGGGLININPVELDGQKVFKFGA